MNAKDIFYCIEAYFITHVVTIANGSSVYRIRKSTLNVEAVVKRKF